MRSRQTALSPLLRSLAGLALMVFVSAQTACFVHCHFGGGHEVEAQPSCHGSPQGAAAHDAPTPPAPASSTTCSTLKTMLAGPNAPTLIAPKLHTLYLLTPLALALDATETEPRVQFSRQAWKRDWVFTPLVCLGPAIRSLAPPFVG